MAISGPSIDIDKDDSTGGVFDAGDPVSIQTDKIIYFKDVSPTYTSSDCVDQTNQERLKNLLNSWGFDDVMVLGISKWKIATQYSAGPRLEWVGNLYVKHPGLQYVKFKDKNKSSQNCYDLYTSGYILLNTHASGYLEADWKWVNISEIGFGMSFVNAYIVNENSNPVSVLRFAQDLKKTTTDISSAETSSYFNKNSGMMALSVLGKYGVDGKRMSFITSVDQTDWGEKEGFQFSSSQKYGTISGSKIKYWASMNDINREIIFENFTKSTTDIWTFNIKTDNGVRIITWDNKQYIVGENAKIKLYKRTPGTLSRPETINNRPNIISSTKTASDNNNNDLPYNYVYPYWDTEAWWDFKPRFELDLYVPRVEKYAEEYEHIFLDYVCKCSGGEIYVEELSNGSFVCNPNIDRTMTTKAENVTTNTIDVPLGVLMGEWEEPPISSQLDPKDATWFGPYQWHDENGFRSCIGTSWSFNNQVFWSGSTFTSSVRMRGILRLVDFKELDFLVFPENFQYAIPGELTSDCDLIQIKQNGSALAHHMMLFRGFELGPGIGDLKGWDMMETDDEKWNKVAATWTIPNTDKTFTAFYYNGNNVYDPLIGNTWVAYPFSTVGFKRTNTNHNLYSYCLVVEYPASGEFTYIYKHESDDLKVNYINNTNVDIKVTFNSVSSIIIPAGEEKPYIIKNYSEVINWIPYSNFTYYDPVLQENKVIYLKDLA